MEDKSSVFNYFFLFLTSNASLDNTFNRRFTIFTQKKQGVHIPVANSLFSLYVLT